MNAQDLLKVVERSNPEKIVVITVDKNRGIGVSWSDMSLDNLCFLKEVFINAVAGKVARSFEEALSSR